MTHIEILANRIHGLERDVEYLKNERGLILRIPDRNINGFVNVAHRSALRRVNNKIRKHTASIDYNYKILKKVFAESKPNA